MQYAVLLPKLLLVVVAVLLIRSGWSAARHRFKVPVAALVIGLVVYPALVVTPPGHRGVVFSQSGGVQTTERTEGLSFVVPWFQSATQIDVRTQKLQIAAYSQSKDLQEITVPVAVNFHVNPLLAAELYRGVGADYALVLIEPAVLQLAKAEVGLQLAEDFAQHREELADAIRLQLEAQLAPYGIVVEFVAIEDAVFDPDFIAAVKAKVIADQVAQEQARLVAASESKARQVAATATGEAARIRIEAEAQAEANQQIAESLTPDLLVWQRILRWDGVLPETVVGSSSPLDLLLPIK